MKIKELIEEGAKKLKLAKIDEPKMKSRILMQFILQKSREYIIVNDKKELEEELKEKYLNNIKKLEEGTPIEHITKQKEFMSLNFYVDENVLIPRQDTEILVEEVIKIAKENNKKEVLDLCTGSRLYCYIYCKIYSKQ